MSSISRAAGAVVGLLLVALGAPASGSSAGDLPNLIPVPGDILLDRADPGTGETALRLETVVANRGTGHLDLLGVADGASTQRATAYQCIAWTADRICGQREEVGDFVWHPDHQHHHFEGFASYELRRLDKKGRPRMGSKGLVAGGEKVSFCLIDYERDDGGGTVLGLPLGWPTYMTCLAGSGSQGISKGWRDVYSPETTGQQIVIDGVVPSTYALVITIDPLDRLHETNESDNVLVYKISLGPDGLAELCIFSQDLKTCAPRKG